MPFTSSATRAGRAATAALLTALSALVLALPARSAGAPAAIPCALTAPKHEASGAAVTFEIAIDCGPSAPNAKPFPVGSDILVGLTLYKGDAKSRLRNKDDSFSKRTLDAPPEVEAALKGATESRAVAAGGPKWMVLTDGEVESYDVPAKVVRLEKGTKRLAIRFQADDKAIAGTRYFLFAAWPGSERRPCDRTSRYARSGCRRDGYVIGDESGVGPIAAYPGLEINEFVHSNGDEWTAERWIVERFR